MTYQVNLELPVHNVWHIGGSKQEFGIEIHFTVGFLTSFVQTCGLQSSGHPSLTEKKPEAYHLLQMLFN